MRSRGTRGFRGGPGSLGLLGSGPERGRPNLARSEQYRIRHGMHRQMNPWQDGMIPGDQSGMMGPRPGIAAGMHEPSRQQSLMGYPDMVPPMGALMGNGRSLMGLDHPMPRQNMHPNAPKNFRPQYGQPPQKMRRLEDRIGGRLGNHSRSSSSSGDVKGRLNDRRSQHSSSRSSRANSSSRSSHRSVSKDSRESSSKDFKKSSAEDSNESSKEEGSSRRSSSKGRASDETEESTVIYTVPVEEIKCHMCGLDSFTSHKAYQSHLKGEGHIEMSRCVHAKNSALLTLLRAEAKMAAQRELTVARRQNRNRHQKLCQCFKCHCKVVAPLTRHMASMEHKLVNNFMIGKCCDEWFSTRVDLEDHKLSLQHQQNEYNKKKEEEDKKQNKPSDSQDNVDRDQNEEDSPYAPLHHLHSSTPALSLCTLPHYTGLAPLAPHTVQAHPALYCTACCTTLEVAALQLHCASYDHYCAVRDSLKPQEEAASPSPKKEAEVTDIVDSVVAPPAAAPPSSPAKTVAVEAAHDDEDHFGEDTVEVDDTLMEDDTMPQLEFMEEGEGVEVAKSGDKNDDNEELEDYNEEEQNDGHEEDMNDDNEAEINDDNETELNDDNETEMNDDNETELNDDNETELNDDNEAELNDDNEAELNDDNEAELNDNNEAMLSDCNEEDQNEVELNDCNEGEQNDQIKEEPKDSDLEKQKDGIKQEPKDSDLEKQKDGIKEEPNDEEMGEENGDDSVERPEGSSTEQGEGAEEDMSKQKDTDHPEEAAEAQLDTSLGDETSDAENQRKKDANHTPFRRSGRRKRGLNETE